MNAKKHLSLILISALLCPLLPTAIGPARTAAWEYKDTGDGIATTRYNGTKGEVEIPGDIDSVPVTVIGEDAFCCWNNNTIGTVTMYGKVSTGVESVVTGAAG